MRTALERVRFDKESTTTVSQSSGIPTRTLRRYVNYSKNPNSLFYLEEPEEEYSDDEIVSWKPQTAVPMFKILGNGDEDAQVSDDLDLTLEDVGITLACDNVQTFAAIDVAAAVASFEDTAVDDTTAKLLASAPADVFDNQEFDQLFQDFVADDMFADIITDV